MQRCSGSGERISPAGLRASGLIAFVVGCGTPPPVITPGPDRDVESILAVFEPDAIMTLAVRPAELSASPLGDEIRPWFRPTTQEAAEGGVASWFGDLGGAAEAVAVMYGSEEAPAVAVAVRGGEAEARALARRFAEAAHTRGLDMVEEYDAGSLVVSAGDTALAALGRGVFIRAPREIVRGALRRVSGGPPDSPASESEAESLLARLDSMAPIVYVGRVPAWLRPRLQHWGLDPLVDRLVGVDVRIGEADVEVRLVARMGDAAEADALAASAAEGIEFAASRTSFRLAGISPLIRMLEPRADGAFFFIEGTLPTPVVAAVATGLRTVSEATRDSSGHGDW